MMLLSNCLPRIISKCNIGLQLKSAKPALGLQRIVRHQSITQSKILQGRNACRPSSTSSYEASDERDGPAFRVLHPGKTLPHQQWVMRMNNQNGYLSWCRNSYLCLSIAVAISVTPMFLAHYGSSDFSGVGEELSYILSGAGALAVCNMLFGSTEFLYQLFKTRPLTQVSWTTIVIYSVFVVIHALLFCDFARSFIKCFDTEDSK